MLSLYDNILTIVDDYLGPAGQRFVDRQIIFHLKKRPEDITKKDVPSLVQWVNVTLALLTDDTKVVQDCSNRIAKLA